jgi:two-component system chemotaxis sensor kinase CheA
MSAEYSGNFQEAYFDEVRELLGELEAALLAIEDDPDNPELIGQVFRALHTIKGSSGMFGHSDVAMFTHDIENVYENVRQGRIDISKGLIDLTLAASDQIKLMTGLVEGEKAEEAKTRAIMTAAREILADLPEPSPEEAAGEASRKKVDRRAVTNRIAFTPEPDIFKYGTKIIPLLNELRRYGECVIVAREEDVPPLEDLDPELCRLSWEITLASSKSRDAIDDVFLFVMDDSELRVEQIAEEDIFALGVKPSRIRDLILSGDRLTKESISELLAEDAAEPAFVPEERSRTSEAADASSVSSVRVKSEKLDELVNLVGELVVVQARLSRISNNREETELFRVAEEVERLTWELRDSALNMRMLPIGAAFNKFRRVARDLARDMGKKASFTVEGGETELDKTVMERLNDPLVHIIRNAIDHGVESPEERREKGKPEQGRVHLSAAQSEGNVVITITDDGKGLDPEKIKRKAISLGLLDENAEPSEQEIFSFVFNAGFSTAEKVTGVSGRGVGMDVVKRNIEALQGRIQLHSKPDEGTTVVLRMPLTLAIMEGMLVRSNRTIYALPMLSIHESFRPRPEDVTMTMDKLEMVKVRERLYPVVRLHEIYGHDPDNYDLDKGILIIVESREKSVCLFVDEILGQQQIVVKPLPSYMGGIEGLSGCMVLADGDIGLILDVENLIRRSEKGAGEGGNE